MIFIHQLILDEFYNNTVMESTNEVVDGFKVFANFSNEEESCNFIDEVVDKSETNQLVVIEIGDVATTKLEDVLIIQSHEQNLSIE